MKGIRKLYTALIVGILVLGTVSCTSDEPQLPTAIEEAFAKLAGNWGTNEGGIVVDGQDMSLNYPGFSLSFTDGGYTTTNAGELFKASGSWDWLDELAEQLNLDDGKEVVIVSLTEEEFVFSFSFAGTGGVANGVNGIAGNYTITVNK